MHAQIVADALGVPYDAIEVNEADTGARARQRADRRVAHLHGRRQASSSAARARCSKRLGTADAARSTCAKHGPLVDHDAVRAAAGHRLGRRDLSRRRLRQLRLGLQRRRGRGRSGHLRGHGRSASPRSHEIGKAIHPMLAAGQIEGGTAQGIGYALLEEVVMRDGRMANAQLTNYIIPTTLDTPPIDVVILENPYAHGPFGAKGVGEMPIDGPAPADRQRDAALRASTCARFPRRRSGSWRRAASKSRDEVHAQRQAASTSTRHPMKRLLDVLREDCGADRHQGRLRRRRVRRVHGAGRRRAGELVPGARSRRSTARA